MSAAPDVAKALIDALPSLDYKKLVEDARRHWNVVVVGEAEASAELIRLLTGPSAPPGDTRFTMWYHAPEAKKIEHLGKTELVIVVGADEATVRLGREQFKDVQQLPILLGEQPPPAHAGETVRVPAIDEEHVRRAIVPALVDRLWERRVPLGRALPPVRERVAAMLIRKALTNPRAALGWVAGSGSGRNGTPTPATAALLVQQAALIVAMGAVYGESLESQRALIARVVPYVTPSLTLDLAESAVTKLVDRIPNDSPLKGYEKIAALGLAVATRSSFSATSTLLVGLAARRVFSGKQQDQEQGRPPAVARAAARTCELGRRAVTGAGHGVSHAAGAITGKLRRQAPAPAEEADQSGTVPETAAAGSAPGLNGTASEHEDEGTGDVSAAQVEEARQGQES